MARGTWASRTLRIGLAIGLSISAVAAADSRLCRLPAVRPLSEASDGVAPAVAATDLERERNRRIARLPDVQPSSVAVAQPDATLAGESLIHVPPRLPAGGTNGLADPPEIPANRLRSRSPLQMIDVPRNAHRVAAAVIVRLPAVDAPHVPAQQSAEGAVAAEQPDSVEAERQLEPATAGDPGPTEPAKEVAAPDASGDSREELPAPSTGETLPSNDTQRPSMLIHVPPASNTSRLVPGPSDPMVPPRTRDVPHAPTIPAGFVPWWQVEVSQPLRPDSQSEPADVTGLVLNALVYSEHILALREQPMIRETAIFEAQAEFDPRAFMESKFIKLSEPVGDELTTGGPPRFRESDWSYSAGLRKKTRRGGQFEVAQRLGYLDNNSLFLLPTQQGNGRLTLSFEQPLLRGAGEYYNNSLVVLAELDTQIAARQTDRDIQQYLLEVHRAYWDMYLQRASLLQLRRSLSRAEEILVSLEQRQDFDSLRSQIVIAQAAVATRRSELIRAAASVRNAESRIKALVNLPGQPGNEALELIPATRPVFDYAPVVMDDALVTALAHRPEVDESVRQMDAARVRLEVSRNELLPALSVVLETYVSGLEGDSRVGRAFLNQFSEGEPSYTAGLVFEVPLNNRAAAARHARRERELRQLTFRFNAVVANLRSEVEVAVREVDTTYREMQSRFASMQAALAEVEFMTQRWQLLPGDDRAASFLLEDLLTAQDRLTDEEYAFVEAQVSYAVAQVELKRTIGVLMEYEVIMPHEMPPAAVDPYLILPSDTPVRVLPASTPSASTWLR